MSVCPVPADDRRFLRRFDGRRRELARATHWHELRRREVILEVSDYIMRLRHAGRDAERWLDRLARLCGTTRPAWAAREAAVVRPGPVLVPAPSPRALLRRRNKALRARGQRPVEFDGREA